MVSGGDKSCVGREYFEGVPNKKDVWACLFEAERATQRPHRFRPGGRSVGPHRGEYISYTKVEPFPECRAGAVFDSHLGENKRAAQNCAESLSRITGNNYEAKQVARRWFGSDIYHTVRK